MVCCTVLFFRGLIQSLCHYFCPLRTSLKALMWRESEIIVWIQQILIGETIEMNVAIVDSGEVNDANEEEVSSEIKDLKCLHEKDTIHLYPTEETRVKIGFLKENENIF